MTKTQLKNQTRSESEVLTHVASPLWPVLNTQHTVCSGHDHTSCPTVP